MKKSTSKKPSSPAPAKKSASARPPVAKVNKPAAAKPAVKPAPPPMAKKSAVKPVATKPVSTTITAAIDIGFGNALYIRGEGPGLSWDRGVLMNCLSDTQWQIVIPESARPVVFKFLVNDLSWNVGEDYTTAAGASVVLEPTF